MATMSVTEAAEELDISREAANKAVRKGTLKVIPNKKPVRVSAEEVQRYRGKTITRSLEECSALVQRSLLCRTLMKLDDGRFSLIRVYGSLTDDQQLNDCIVVIGDQYDRAAISDQELVSLFAQIVTHLRTGAVPNYSYSGRHSATFAGAEPAQWYDAAQNYDWMDACWCIADSYFLSVLTLSKLDADNANDLFVKFFGGSLLSIEDIDPYIVGGFTTYPKPSYDPDIRKKEDEQLREIIRKDQSDDKSLWIVDPMDVSSADDYLMMLHRRLYSGVFDNLREGYADHFSSTASIAARVAKRDMQSRTSQDLPRELRSERLCVNVRWWKPVERIESSRTDVDELRSRAETALHTAELMKREVDGLSRNYNPSLINAIDSLVEIIRYYSNEPAAQLPREFRENDTRIIDVETNNDDELMMKWIDSLSPVEENLTGNDPHARRVRKMIAARGAYNVPILEDEYGALAYTVNDEESWFVLPVADLELIEGFSRDDAVVHVRRSSSEALLLTEFGDGELTPLPTVSRFGRMAGYESGATQSAIDILAAKHSPGEEPNESKELNDLVNTLGNKDFMSLSLSLSLNGGE